jgi:stage II sporulation protein D
VNERAKAIPRRLRPILATAIALTVAVVIGLGLFAAPSAYAAEGDFVFTGLGYGHGVGMSQWGAWQAAREGVSYDQILAFYYPGTTLQTFDYGQTEVVVRISSKPWTSNVLEYAQVDLRPAVTPMMLVGCAGDQREVEEIPLDAFINVFNRDGKITVVTTADGVKGPYDHIQVRPVEGSEREGRISIQLKTSAQARALSPREYWGGMRVQPSSTAGKLVVYNHVLLEKYLRSIAEVEYDWAQPKQPGAYALEAVKAQTVAARSYAVAKNAALYDNQNDQCYVGYTGRSAPGATPFEMLYPGIPAAAEVTKGQILVYNGKPATAYYSAHSGGYTTDSAWSGTCPAYIVSQPDPWSLKSPPTGLDSAGPGYNWTYTISPATLSNKVNNVLTNITTKKKCDVGFVRRVEVAARDTADAKSHATTLRLTGEKGVALVSAASFRNLFGYSQMRSTLILSITGGEPLAPGRFYDVGLGHLYREAVFTMAARGVINGYSGDRAGLFGPNDPVMRQQFAKMITLTLGLEPLDAQSCPFADVAAGWPYPRGYVATAAKRGITTGHDDGTYRPYDDISRAQVATMVVRAAGDALRSPPGDYTGLLKCGNLTHGVNIRKAEFNHLFDGIVASESQLLGWNTAASATRGECAQMLWNLMKSLGL